MNKSLWWILIFVILFFSGAIFYNNQKAKQESIDLREQAIQKEESRPSITLNSKHQYKDGMHTFVGSIELPNACYTYSAEIIRRENNGIEIALKMIPPADQTKVCAEVITTKTFKAEFAGPADANIYATLNGELVNLNIFEVDPSEKIEDVELNIKG